MINARGAIVLVLVVAAALIGYTTGRDNERARWERWTYAHVAFDTKGDRR